MCHDAAEREGLSAELQDSKKAGAQLIEDVDNLTAQNASLEGRLEDLSADHRSLQ